MLMNERMMLIGMQKTYVYKESNEIQTLNMIILKKINPIMMKWLNVYE